MTIFSCWYRTESPLSFGILTVFSQCHIKSAVSIVIALPRISRSWLITLLSLPTTHILFIEPNNLSRHDIPLKISTINECVLIKDLAIGGSDFHFVPNLWRLCVMYGFSRLRGKDKSCEQGNYRISSPLPCWNIFLIRCRYAGLFFYLAQICQCAFKCIA